MVGIHANESETFDFLVNLQLDRSIAPKIHAADLEDEAESLWRPYGVRLEWIDDRLSAAAEDRLSVQAIVARRIDGPEPPEWKAVLGRAFVELGALSRRPISLSFDATETLLELRKSSRASTIRGVFDHEMARALGRVLAHEIGHVLLAAPYHDATGLMRAAFSPDELAEMDRRPFRLACTSVARLRGRLRVLTEDPRFARRDDWTGGDRLEGTEPERLDRSSCIPNHRAAR